MFQFVVGNSDCYQSRFPHILCIQLFFVLYVNQNSHFYHFFEIIVLRLLFYPPNSDSEFQKCDIPPEFSIISKLSRVYSVCVLVCVCGSKMSLVHMNHSMFGFQFIWKYKSKVVIWWGLGGGHDIWLTHTYKIVSEASKM